jgi:hypothetical protein
MDMGEKNILDAKKNKSFFNFQKMENIQMLSNECQARKK